MSLNVLWYVLVGLLFMGYAILDGFDLGVGAWHLFVKKDEERRVLLNSIGPVWDGNEVWLVTAGGALFAAFPEAYATVFSGFYLPFIVFLCTLIFRAVAIEARSKQPMRWWRQVWDVSFSLSSILTAFLIGVVLGNLIYGIPLTADHELAESFRGLLHPYALLVGLTTVALFLMHGGIYVVLKTEGALQEKFRRWAVSGVIFFIICYAMTTMTTLIYVPRMASHMRQHPLLFGVAVLNVLAIANIPRELNRKRDGWAFISSCGAVAALLTLFGIGVFPNLIISSPNPENSLTLVNAASTSKTLGIMGIVALIGAPLVISYSVAVHWIFRGKVKLEPTSY